MKIIHSSDWHLGQRLYNYDRTDEERYFFKQLRAAVAEERPDALLVCGDVYHTGAPGNDVAKEFTEELLAVHEQCPTMMIVVIAGNHDSYSRLEVDSALWRRCNVHVVGAPAEDAKGRADFARNVIELPGKGIIAAVPFCYPRNFPAYGENADGDRMQEYFRGLNEYVGSVAAQQREKVPAVLMAHLAVGKDTEVTGQIIGAEECVELSLLGAQYDYIALGHIHCPQWIKGEKKVARYCGTPRAIHFDEAYAHGVDVVTLEAGHELQHRQIQFPPLHALATLGGKEGKPFDEVMKEFAEKDLVPETYVRLNVVLQNGEDVLADWVERARKLAIERSLRYCTINPIRTAEDVAQPLAEQRLTTQQLKELSNDAVLDILSEVHELSERQKELLKDLMAKMANE